jgi:hypothetical protein
MKKHYETLIDDYDTRKSPADLFRRQDKKKTERGRNWHDSKQPYCIVIVTIPAVVRLHDIIEFI